MVQTGTGAAGEDTSPAWVGLIANRTLLPERAPTYLVSDGTLVEPDGGLRTKTWLLRCNADDVAAGGDCADDSDRDGYPALGDCDDGDAHVYPGSLAASAPGIDGDCDGWRTP